jgi:hypothetical protein
MADIPHSALLCVEADEQLFRLSLENFADGIKNSYNLQLTNLHEKAALCAFVRQTWGARRFRRVEMLRLSGGWQLFPDLYNSLEETLGRELALDWGNAMTLAKLGRLYMRNALRNLALVSRYPSLEKLSFGDSPVLVLGAGPSLDCLLDGLMRRFGVGLEKNKRPFKIVCVDTCLRALRARNIEPDLAVVLESQHWNLRDFIGLGDWKIRAALDISALPASARLPGMNGFLFFTPWTEIRLFARLEQAGLLPKAFPPLGSVGLSATAIALSLTSSLVLIGGMDFSFSHDASHARSTPAHFDKLTQHNRFNSLLNLAAFEAGNFSAMSKSGEQVRSNPSLRNYRDLFEREFAPQTRLYDIRSSGLPLGINTPSQEEYFEMLGSGGRASETDESYQGKNHWAEKMPEKLAAFISGEKNRLTELKNILSGGTEPLPSEPPPTPQALPLQKLETLIDECDYLWAHFPDYAGTGGRRPGTEDLLAGTPAAISFLKRLRAEIDPVLKIFDN